MRDDLVGRIEFPYKLYNLNSTSLVSHKKKKKKLDVLLPTQHYDSHMRSRNGKIPRKSMAQVPCNTWETAETTKEIFTEEKSKKQLPKVAL